MTGKHYRYTIAATCLIYIDLTATCYWSHLKYRNDINNNNAPTCLKFGAVEGILVVMIVPLRRRARFSSALATKEQRVFYVNHRNTFCGVGVAHF